MEGQALDALAIFFGVFVVIVAIGLAIRTFMVPSGAPPFINRFVFRLSQVIFDGFSRLMRTESRRHLLLSLYAPVSLLIVLMIIMVLIAFGYTLTFYGVGIKPLLRSFLFSASGISTLGFESPGGNLGAIIFSAAEALTMTTVVALLIGYLPGIYTSYQQREQAVNSLDELAGSQPDGVRVVDSFLQTYGAAKLGGFWQSWLDWFRALASAGSTLSGELYLRSSSWDRAWICAAGAMLDAASLVDSCLDLTTDPAAERLVHFGSNSLRQVLEPLNLQCPKEPSWPETGINITQDEFYEAYDHFKSEGLPMKPDRDAAWPEFARLRVRYECQLMALVRLKKPPGGARWTTDRVGAQTPLALPVVGLQLVDSGTTTAPGQAKKPSSWWSSRKS